MVLWLYHEKGKPHTVSASMFLIYGVLKVPRSYKIQKVNLLVESQWLWTTQNLCMSVEEKMFFIVRMNELGISSCIFLWNSQPDLHQSLLNFSPSIFQSILATFLSLLSHWCHSWWVCLIQKMAWKCIFSDCPTSFFSYFVTQSATHPVAVFPSVA